MNLRIMMRRLNKRNLWLLLLPFLLTACQSYKKVPYFQNVEVVNEAEQQEKLYDAKIMPKDLLTIVVSCTNPELAIPFNLTVASNAGIAVSTSSYVTTQPVLQPYLVDNEGNISFPVLGELHLGGLTKKQAEQVIVEKLSPYMKETPIVTVRMVNYKISVIGEVTRSAKGYELEVYDEAGEVVKELKVGYQDFSKFSVKANFRFAATNLPGWVELEGGSLDRKSVV